MLGAGGGTPGPHLLVEETEGWEAEAGGQLLVEEHQPDRGQQPDLSIDESGTVILHCNLLLFIVIL